MTVHRFITLTGPKASVTVDLPAPKTADFWTQTFETAGLPNADRRATVNEQTPTQASGRDGNSQGGAMTDSQVGGMCPEGSSPPPADTKDDTA